MTFSENRYPVFRITRASGLTDSVGKKSLPRKRHDGRLMGDTNQRRTCCSAIVPSCSVAPPQPCSPKGAGPFLRHRTANDLCVSGNRYLRTMIMQGARVILLWPANWAKHSFGPWLTAAANGLHHNVLATALANKLARIAWTVLMQERSCEARAN